MLSSPPPPSPLLQIPHTYRAFYGAFSHLYPIQQKAIEPILDGKDVVLQSATGSGKTEAVLAPCLERIIQSGRAAAAVYVVPTRALAIDIERRLASIFTDRLGLRLSVRTGDVKRAGGERPDLLLTTPESLDVTLGSANPDIRAFVQRVRTVIIDEVYPLVHTYRGHHLAYLLHRLEQRIGAPLQKIALSATIADVDAIIRFFHFHGDAIRLIEPVHRDIIPHLVHLEHEENEFPALLDDLYDRWAYRKILVFANSRGRCDRLFALMNGSIRFHGAADLHYSNLKSRERRAVEQRFRKRSHALCIATSTLELGIDIGDVDGVVLYEPPDSVAAFLQRIGRSNRRQSHTHVWGVCRGEKAALQLLRFLGLIRLARRGEIEALPPTRLPSVLIQQILSCLYEKRRVSLPALQSLFPDEAEALSASFSTLLAQGWLREDSVKGLIRGGRHYRDCLLERRIWSNFPEQEEDYTLELADEAIADIPTSVVRQLDPGDRVLLAGKRMQILKIDTGARKHVVAQPAAQVDDKDIFWLGAGFRVTYEVAQAIQEVMQRSAETPDGLFARTRRLLQAEQERNADTVKLANGIEVNRTTQGLYRYYTFLGSLGNLILQWTIEHEWGQQDDTFTISSDEIGIECSHLITFQALPLPVNHEAFRRWSAQHLKALKTLFPLNAFCAVLPQSLLIEEVTDFLFDARIAGAFAHYRTSSSEIVSGDPSVLEREGMTPEPSTPVVFDTAMLAEPLLTWEKQRWQIAEDVPPRKPGLAVPLKGDRSPRDYSSFAENTESPAAYLQQHPRTLTATAVGEFMRHQQCERWLNFEFLPPRRRPEEQAERDTSLSVIRTEYGHRHEAHVLDYLRTLADTVVVVEETDVSGHRHSLKKRYEASMTQLDVLIQAAQGSDRETQLPTIAYLAQATLIWPGIFPRAGVSKDTLRKVDGVGIPDLIRITPGIQRPILEVGDIKDSAEPYISQKWQVAFYAFLLTEICRQGALPAEVASTGFLITRPRPGSQSPETHGFDLRPFLTTFPELLRNIAAVLLRHPHEATYRLQPHCTTCSYFTYCYRQALEMEDIQFLPQLTEGALEKLRHCDLHTVQAAGAWINQPSHTAPFGPHQRDRLKGRLTAMETSRIYIRERKTRLYPDNLSTALFLHLIEDPFTSRPCGLGLCAVDRTGIERERQIWIAANDTENEAVLVSFTNTFLRLWQASVGNGQGPHVFHVGGRSWRAVTRQGDEHALSFLYMPGRTHHTDLLHILTVHFDLPMPGRPTLFAIARLLGLSPEPPPPESLFHEDEVPAIPLEDTTARRPEIEAYLNTSLTLQVALWRWMAPHLESEWTQDDWVVDPDITTAYGRVYLDFLEEERRLREEDVLTLQAYPLTERVERFRAIGPITFLDRTLDEEGRFLYRFQMPPDAGLSKFREGDFLKLAPAGIQNIQDGYGVILHDYDHRKNTLSIRSRQRRLAVTPRLAYSLEEDLTDWNGPKLAHAVRTVFSDDRHLLSDLLSGVWNPLCDPSDVPWVESWLQRFGEISGLNPMQQQALALPFHRRVGLIEGPPGTGKTHLLGWTLIALILHAYDMGRPMRIAVSALTHQAIDHVLTKVTDLVNENNIQPFPGRCFKWGRAIEELSGSHMETSIAPLSDVSELVESRYAIVGATGFGLYQLFESEKGVFPQAFDWIVFDEASQVLIPQAFLSLLYGKGGYLFYGDAHQLSPIVLGTYDEAGDTGVNRSILRHLLDRYDASHRIRLDRTYRMNAELCAFPSRTWYEGDLQPAPENAHIRLALAGPRCGDLMDRLLDPERPVTLLIIDHHGCHQQSDDEVDVMTELAWRLLAEHGLDAEQLALISPHRAQNNAITARLSERLGGGRPLPLIDTVERVQGAERDVILYAFTTSDLDHVMSEFLNNPNRFNVAITRARRKLIVIGSHPFFTAIPQTEEALKANACFKAFVEYCREQESLFIQSGPGLRS